VKELVYIAVTKKQYQVEQKWHQNLKKKTKRQASICAYAYCEQFNWFLSQTLLFLKLQNLKKWLSNSAQY